MGCPYGTMDWYCAGSAGHQGDHYSNKMPDPRDALIAQLVEALENACVSNHHLLGHARLFPDCLDMACSLRRALLAEARAATRP